jgi:hypothetical protein
VDGEAGQLIHIDTVDGSGTAVGSLGYSEVQGPAFDPNTDTLYGSDVATDR